jgi:plasmid stabilization system protein ParE
MKIEFTSLALEDLEALRLYLAERSPSGLANVVEDIETTVHDIPRSVSRGRKTPRDDVWERITPKYRFRLPYHIRGDTLYILRVYRGNRRPLRYEALDVPE